jgi:caa(3)-type oxidase subunit IV
MSNHDEQGHNDEHGHHEGPGYVKVYFILLVLFLISVAGPEIRDSGVIEMSPMVGNAMVLITAFGIALVKAYYVIAYFMHLKFERKIVTYMLTTTIVFMMLFFAAVAPDIMKHSGSNWVNAAAASEVERALEEQKNPPKVETNELADPASLTGYARTGESRYQIPIEKAMKMVVNDRARAVQIIVPVDPNAATPEMFAAAEAKGIELAAAPRTAFAVDAAKAKLGSELFTTKTCSACHSIDGSKLVGPTFKGLIGRVTLTEKAEVFVADAAYFTESIKAPQAKISRGYKNAVMPKLPVSDTEIDALLHYVASLKAPAAAAPAPASAPGAAAPSDAPAAQPTEGDAPAKAGEAKE